MKLLQYLFVPVFVLLFTLTTFAQTPQLSCDLVDPSDPNHDSFFPISDLNVLNGYIGTMTDSITGNGPVPLCNNGGAPHNISWFSFIAPAGEYSMILTTLNCTDENGMPPGTGIQSGVYTDCTFSEQVGPCFGIPCTRDPIEIPNIDVNTGEYILVPGETYFWFLDGCAGTICEFEIVILGNAIPGSQVVCIDSTICRVDAPNGVYGYFESGTYTDTFSISNGLDSIRTLKLTISEESYVLIQEQLCEGDVIIIDEMEYSQDADFEFLAGQNVGGCDSIVQVSLRFSPSPISMLPTQFICEGDTIIVEGLEISEVGRYAINVGQTNIGCDSSVFLFVEMQSDSICDPSCESVSNDFLVDRCDKTLTFCNLNDLDSICFTMIEEVTGNGPDPICSSGGVVHNISWIAFVAGEGDYTIKVTPENCTPGEADLKGISFGIYTDCTFSEEVFCIGFPTAEDPIEVPSKNMDDGYLLTPGETYYLFIDGAAGSVCDIQMEILGDFIPFDAQIRTEDLVCEFKDGIGNCIDTLLTGTEIRITAGTVSVETRWSITRVSGSIIPNSWTSSGELNAGRITTDSNFIDVSFLEAGEFNIVCLGSDHPCYATQVTFPSKGVVVKRSVSNKNEWVNPILQVFPNPTKEQITYTLNHAQTSMYKLISLHGEIMLTGKGNTRQVEVDLKELPHGTYILEVITAEGQGVKKVVKL